MSKRGRTETAAMTVHFDREGMRTIVYSYPELDDRYLLAKVSHRYICLVANPFDTVDLLRYSTRLGCDEFYFHLDCSLTTAFPVCRTELIRKLTEMGATVINGHLTDTRKRSLQAINVACGLPSVAATRWGDPEELIIVKTNYNAGACRELLMHSDWRMTLGLHDVPTDSSGKLSYIVARRKAISTSIWANSAFVTECFIENPLGIWYRAYIKGRRMALCCFKSPTPIKKVGKSALEGIQLIDLIDRHSTSEVFRQLVLLSMVAIWILAQ